MNGKVALVGGNEFRPPCEPMDTALLKATGRDRPSVLVVPTAAADQGPSRAASNGVQHFSGLGADAAPLMVLVSAQANDAALLAPVESADLVYLAGGDPSHLLSVLKGSLLLDKLREAAARGAVLAGSSAGAMVMASWMRYRGWTQALGLGPDIAVLPHHEGTDRDKVARELDGAAPDGTHVLGIDSMTCCFGVSGRWEVLGPGAVTLYSDGHWARFRSGEAVPVPVDLGKL